MLETKNLRFKYDNDSELSFPDIKTSKENLLILGASGVGKTTFLHLLSGLLKPLEGEIDLIGTPISKLTMSEMDRFRGKNIGIVFQKPHFINSLTVKENLQLAQYISKKIDKTRINSLLESLGIEDKADKKTLNLSLCEKKIFSIALEIVNSPKLILADEQTSSLDDLNCDKVINLLKDQAAKYKAKLIIITHDYRLKKHFKNTLSL
jgi:putative ABC transport system ATP-binding protein